MLIEWLVPLVLRISLAEFNRGLRTFDIDFLMESLILAQDERLRRA